MNSFTVPCLKVLPLVASSSQSSQKCQCIASFPRSESRLNPSSMLAHFQGCNRSQSDGLKLRAQLNEVAIEKTPHPVPAVETVLHKKSKSQYEINATSMSLFMNKVSDLVKLVDSRDIVELQLKQSDCEIVIRKQEALPQPSIAAPVFFAPPTHHQATLPPQPPLSNALPSTPTSAPTPTKPQSSHPPFKSPMAGNFYRAPAPDAPPFVKVGDKVQKGQTICIIEAMKLMNEIETDQSGTIVEILVDNETPVSMDTPLFIIEP